MTPGDYMNIWTNTEFICWVALLDNMHLFQNVKENISFELLIQSTKS